MLDSVYHMALKLIKILFWRVKVKNLPSFTQHYNERHNITLHNLYATSDLLILFYVLYHSQIRCHVIYTC